MDFPQREPDQLEGVPPPEYQQAVYGHAQASAALLERLNAGRMPGGVLIHGPRGIGKATLAFDLARRIFEATGDESPQHIAAQVAAGAYPNLFVMRKAPRDTGKGYYTVIRVEEVRGFIEEMRMTRGRAGHRIAIVDPIDDCNASSANALLKILEEPPADTTFLLVSHRPGSLLPTIKSRCFQVALRPVSDADVRTVLEQNSADPALVDRAVSLAGGKPRRAFEAMLLGEGGTLTLLQSWLANPSGSAAPRLALADALGGDRESAELRFARDIIADWIADEAKAAAFAADGARLASANELWDKAQLSLADADEYNLDMRQTLVAIFDAIRKHHQLSVAPSAP
ncbi:AAA family ATPase [Devosia sp. ZB163]|uniref:AAA family ATPase n=1 Tax=Devosia sp. ZB163 TaxID=3025938 RepID=UPI00235FF7EB|nr:AAA family ATPase [Devosia sp. ZB163]MDC9824699.1 AAA family ATPase [Devosia sp. ZB163]